MTKHDLTNMSSQGGLEDAQQVKFTYWYIFSTVLAC